MSIRADVYYNTGFDTINIPYSPTMLDNLAHTYYEGLDILQTYPVRSIRIPLSPMTVQQAQSIDYVKLTADGQLTCYYSVPVGGVVLTSPDVVTIQLVIDYITTLGGIANVDILTGMTQRRTVKKSDDTFGAYIEDDPLMGCNEPLKIVSGGWLDVGKTCSKIFVESTVALPRMADTKTGTTYTDSDGNTVTIPATVGLAGVTTYGLSGESITAPSRGTRMYGYNADATGTDVQNGMDAVRAIGAESAIISQYTVPDDMYTAEYPTGETGQKDYTYTAIKGTSVDKTTGLAYNWNPQVINKRILYGANCQYTLMTAAGNSATFKPEDIYDSTADSPVVVIKSDPRPGGRPYFRFKKYLSDTGSFWANAVQGETWRDVPLVYNRASGNLLDLYHFASTRDIQQQQYDYGMQSRQFDIQRKTLDRVADTASTVGQGFLSGGLLGGLITGTAAVTSNLVSGDLDYQAYNLQQDYERGIYRSQRAQAEAELGIQTRSVAPTVAIPPSAGCIRDFAGNSCLVYRTRPSDTDVARLDKILGLYGYRQTKILENADLNTRSKFTYISATGVEIQGTIPRWLKEGVNSVLSAGVRIWRVTPDQSAYLTNE